MGTFLYRIMGAAMLDSATYEQLEVNKLATFQALLVVLLSSMAFAIGGGFAHRSGLAGFAIVAAIALGSWVAWAYITLQIGARLLPAAETRTNVGELLRTLGFAAAPGLLQVFGIIPGVTVPVFLITSIWMFAAMVIAIREALEYEHVGRALIVCALGGLLTAALVMLISYATGGRPS
jgi:Yip1-like protein